MSSKGKYPENWLWHLNLALKTRVSAALFMLGFIGFILPVHAHAKGLTLAWNDPDNIASTLDGYYVYHWLLGSTEKKRSTVSKAATCPQGQPAGTKCFTVMGLESGKSYQFEVTAFTDQGSQQSEPSKAITHYFAANDETVLDNTAAHFTAAWHTSNRVAGFLGNNYRGINTGTPNATATWQPNLTVSGLYQVSAWWSAHSERATNAPFTIHYNGGQQTVNVNQTQQGNQWVDLGTYDFKAGNTGRVVLSAQAQGKYIVADAVRFTLKPNTNSSITDSDQDGLTDQRELAIGTNPNRADSDGDGVDDGSEIADGSDPLEPTDQEEPVVNLPKVNIMVDNRYASYTGAWSKSTDKPGYIGQNYRVATSGNGDSTATWQPELPFAGTYEVFARWTHDAQRSTNAPYTVIHANGNETIQVDQTKNGGKWVPLGTFSFMAGTEGMVTLSNHAAGESVVADAVQFVLKTGKAPAEPVQDVITIDNLDASYTKTWKASTSSKGYYGRNYHGIATGKGEATATWQPDLQFAGIYEVSARWSQHSKRARNAPYTIIHAEGDDTVEVDQTRNGGKWMLLGTYSFAPGTEGMVTLSNDSNGNWVVADAIQFTLLEITQDPNRPMPREYPEPTPDTGGNVTVPDVDVVVDNSDAAFTGNWKVSTAKKGFIGKNYAGTLTGKGEATATWRPDLPVAGRYKVFARWTEHRGRATHVPYTVLHADGKDTVRFNQTKNGGKWVEMGTYSFLANTDAMVTLSNDSIKGWVVADAVRFVLVEVLAD